MADDLAKLPPQTRGLNAITGAMSLIVVLLIVQIWLLTATLDSYLANRHKVVMPAAIASGLVFACCLILYLFVEKIDREGRRTSKDMDR
jgi:UDP-N-acetylmuramyl pentapeptide phosphotransferase/UDP-N-acetylglucosamine-1-phosphate transferase